MVVIVERLLERARDGTALLHPVPRGREGDRQRDVVVQQQLLRHVRRPQQRRVEVLASRLDRELLGLRLLDHPPVERLAQVLLVDEQLALPLPAPVASETAGARAEGGLEVVHPRAHRLGVCADERSTSRSRRALGAGLGHGAASVDHAELDRVQLLVEADDCPALR
eukprot:4309719-Prymnesium_polylepis.1